MTEPFTIRSGDSIAWTRDIPAYPPSADWALKYRRFWPAGTAADIAATPDRESYSIDGTPNNTGSYTAGRATLVAWVERTNERVTLGQYPVEILPDLSAVSVFDGGSSAEKALADAKAELEDYLTKGQAHVAEYWISNVRMRFRAAEDFLRLIAHLEQEVRRERAAKVLLDGGGPPGQVFVTM